MAERELVEEKQSPPLFKKRGPKKHIIRKREARLWPNSDSQDETSADEERSVKRRRKTDGVITSSLGSKNNMGAQDLYTSEFHADRTAQLELKSDATKQSNWYDEGGMDDSDATNLLGSIRTPLLSGASIQSSGTYNGVANYKNFAQRHTNAPKQVGPIKAPTNVRTITVTDYSPDTCKDYKQTGFCGWGDNCKFLHAREDYKQGWQLDREWENVTKGEKITGGKVISSRTKAGEAIDYGEEDDLSLEGIPFACILCRESYKNPVVTKCGHYFCEACALTRFKKTPSCAACGTGTGGVFNGAKNLKKILERKTERVARTWKERKEEGQQASDNEGEMV